MGQAFCNFSFALFEYSLTNGFPFPDGTKYVSVSLHPEYPRVMKVVIENDLIPDLPKGDPLPEYILIIETDRDGNITRRELTSGA